MTLTSESASKSRAASLMSLSFPCAPPEGPFWIELLECPSFFTHVGERINIILPVPRRGCDQKSDFIDHSRSPSWPKKNKIKRSGNSLWRSIGRQLRSTGFEPKPPPGHTELLSLQRQPRHGTWRKQRAI